MKINVPNLYKELYQKSVDDYDDELTCALIAISSATGIEYSLVNYVFEKYGRKHRNGSNRYAIDCVIHELGFVDVDIDFESKTLLTIQRELPNKGTFLIFSTGHVSCFKDGVLYDWCGNRKFRVHDVIKLVDCNGE